MAELIRLDDLEQPEWVEKCRAEIDAIFALYPEGTKSAIMPLLHLAQRERGHVALADMQAIAELLDVSVAYVDSVCSFYSMYHRHPVGKYVLTFCGALTCHHLAGGKKLIEQVEKALGIKDGETMPDGLITLEVTPECLAACDLAPAAQCNVEYLTSLTAEKLEQLIAALRGGRGPDEFIEKLPLMNGEAQGQWKGYQPLPGMRVRAAGAAGEGAAAAGEGAAAEQGEASGETVSETEDKGE